VYLLGLDVLYRRRLAGGLIDRVHDDAVFTALENWLAFKLGCRLGTICPVHKTAVRMVLRRYFYVATSSSAPGYGAAGTEHHVTAFRIDPESGALTPHGEPMRLPARPIHVSTDIPSEN
jgi:hypothetical protein